MHRYSITGKGLQFLEIYDSLGHMMEDEDKGEEQQI
jgi:hypothetical protein